MIKAAAGGGGRGIRVARDMAEFERLFPQASAEALAAFGDGGLYLERLIERARHIEVQVLGDGKRRRSTATSANARCSGAARRSGRRRRRRPCRQDVRERLCASAVALARSVGYRGAGTLEYLYDDATQEFFFLEMNTRIQVEHPVTEWITGIDLVARDAAHRRRREAAAAAGGHRPPRPCDRGAHLRRGPGATASCRAPGIVGDLRVPGGPGVRFDSMLYSGYAIPPFYDSLLGKLIVWGEDRAACHRAAEARARASCEIGGVKTTKPLFAALADDAERARRQRPHRLARRLARDERIETGLIRGRRQMSIRYSFGGDEHVFVEVDEEMSLQAFFKSLSMTNAVRDSRISGRHRDLPGQRLVPDQVRPRPDQPGRHAGGAEEPGGCGREGRVGDQDADHRGAGLLPRPVDAPRR